MKYKRVQTTSFCWLVLASIAIVLIFSGAAAAANPKLCFTQVTGLPKANPAPPPAFIFPNNPPNLTILNDPTNHPVDPDLDTGWFDAFRVPFENGTPHPEGAMQAIAQSSGANQMLYFSFKVKNDSDLDISDAIVLGFSSLPPETQNSPQTYKWIVIQPFALSGAPSAPQVIPDTLIKVWTGTNMAGNVSWGGSFTTVHPWITAVEASDGPAGGPFVWYVIVRIDNSDPNGPQLPLSGNFGLLLDTVATQDDGSDRQFIFPSALGSLVDTTNADPSNPASNQWADATFDTNCSGIHFDHPDITNTVNGSQTPIISWTQTNNFSVKVHNSGADAPQVRATFKIANFGLPAQQEYAPIGTLPNNDNLTGNPTAFVDVPAHTTPPGSCGDGSGDGCTTMNAPAWTLGPGNVAYYSQPANQHECVRVDLESLTGNTTFMNSSSWNNFDFAAMASKYVSPPAFVSGKYPPAKGAAPGAPQQFDLFVTEEKLPLGQRPPGAIGGGCNATGVTRPIATAVGKPEKNCVVSAINIVVHACRRTGQFITIDPPPGAPGNPKPQKFENCEPVGAYGYGITHVGTTAVTNWTFSLSGDGLTRVRPGVYRLSVPQDGRATVVTNVEPEYPGEDRLAVFFDFGGAFPHGTFSNAFDPGFSFNAGLEYIVNPHFSAEGIFGAHHFPGKIGGDTTAIQFGGGGKVFLNPGHANLVFARAGIAGYHFTSATTNVGGYFGAGLLHQFNAHLGLEGVYTFHAVNTPVAATQFSTVQGGVRYAF